MVLNISQIQSNECCFDPSFWKGQGKYVFKWTHTQVPPSGHCLAGKLPWTLIVDSNKAVFYSMVVSHARVKKC